MNTSGKIGAFIGITALAIGLIATPSPLHAEGSEARGNQPIEAVSGIPTGFIDLANLKNRAYWREVNGDYHFFYRGDTSAMNEAIGKFAAVATGAKEVIVRPGRGQTKTFQGEPVRFDFEMHIPGGLFTAILGKVKTKDGADVFGSHPRLILYVFRPAGLKALQIPAGLRVIDLGEMKRRYVEIMNATTLPPNASSVTARGFAAFSLGELGPIGREIVAPLLSRVDDPDPYMRSSALIDSRLANETEPHVDVSE